MRGTLRPRVLISAAMNCPPNSPGANRGSRRVGPPKLCWNRRPRPRRLSRRRLRWLARPKDRAGGGRHSPPARCPIRRPSATSPTRRVGSCRRRTPRGVSCKGTTAKRPSMRLPRLLWPPTSLMSRMTSSTPRRCSPRYSPIRTGPPDRDEGRGLLQRGERHGQHRPGLLAPDPAGPPASQPDRADSSSRTTASGTVGGRSDAPHPPHDARTTGLCSAQSDCRAGVRPDQAGPRLSAILVARDAAGVRRMGAQLYDPQWAQALALLASATPTSRRGAAGLGQKPEGGAERPQGSRRSPGASVLSPRECWINWNDQTARRSMSDRLLGFLKTGMNPSSDCDADLIDGF